MSNPSNPSDRAPVDVHEYRLRIQPQDADHAWRAELRDVDAPAGAAALTFDTPLELARHLARLAGGGLSSPNPPGAGLR